MKTPTNLPDDERTFETLVRRLAPGDAAPGNACPRPDLLVGYADGRLLTRERERLEGHLAACETCRSLVAGLAETAVPAATGRGRLVVLARAWPYLAAAGVILAVALAALGPGLLFGRRSTDELLVAAASDLARARPDLFGGFRALDAAERAATDGTVLRSSGAVTLLAPRGKVLETRPAFRWEGGGRATVVLETDDGRPLWRAEGGEELGYPEREAPLAPGSACIWSVETGATRSDGLLFHVASAAERDAAAAARATVDARAPARVAKLLYAHWALRRGLLAEAERATRAYLADHPGDVAGQETLRRATGR